MTNYFCPDCGELLMIDGHCWVCGYDGTQVRGIGGLEMEPNAEQSTRLDERSETNETRERFHCQGKAASS